MKKRIGILGFVTIIAVILLQVALPGVSLAEETNRNEVRQNLSNGGWSIVYGDLINEHDYYEFAAAVAKSVASENPAPLYEFFDGQLQVQIQKISREAPWVAEETLKSLIVQSFKGKGQILRNGRLEISGGLVTYKRWQIVIYDEPRTYKCKQSLPFGG